MTISSPGSTSRTTTGADDVERGGLAGDHPAALEPAEDQRADALRVAGGVEGVSSMKTSEKAPRSCGSTSSAAPRASVGVVGEQRGDQEVSLVAPSRLRMSALSSSVGVGELGDHLGELGGVGQVAVVAQRDRAVGGRVERRLGVLPGARTRSWSSGVADREVALERLERRLVEDLETRPMSL
jgi:hypothetical protein